ncbi:Uu.00g028390.m01.CDS01 [Anthostomella pinea]|uniref:Uu.00g028390.m01.CDS01 n=1 Tax=Anthostomella pinea TaxID=933095 RepID=A0AAI8V7X7_9PEZI|nr:Uu.00g028390.m01.CDS01 [Anthostomella pinea]
MKPENDTFHEPHGNVPIYDAWRVGHDSSMVPGPEILNKGYRFIDCEVSCPVISSYDPTQRVQIEDVVRALRGLRIHLNESTSVHVHIGRCGAQNEHAGFDPPTGSTDQRNSVAPQDCPLYILDTDAETLRGEGSGSDAGLEREGYPPVSERDIHHMIAEAVVGPSWPWRSRPGVTTSQLEDSHEGLDNADTSFLETTPSIVFDDSDQNTDDGKVPAEEEPTKGKATLAPLGFEPNTTYMDNLRVFALVDTTQTDERVQELLQHTKRKLKSVGLLGFYNEHSCGTHVHISMSPFWTNLRKVAQAIIFHDDALRALAGTKKPRGAPEKGLTWVFSPPRPNRSSCEGHDDHADLLRGVEEVCIEDKFDRSPKTQNAYAPLLTGVQGHGVLQRVERNVLNGLAA